MKIKFTNVGKKQSQKELIKEIMDLDAKDGLYEISNEEIESAANEHNRKGYFISPSSFVEGAKWYRKQLKKYRQKAVK
jgi:hypothetical protein